MVSSGLAGRLDTWALYCRKKGLYWNQTRALVGSELSGVVDGRGIRSLLQLAGEAHDAMPLA